MRNKIALELALNGLMEGKDEEIIAYAGKDPENVYIYLMSHIKDLENIGCRKVKIKLDGDSVIVI